MSDSALDKMLRNHTRDCKVHITHDPKCTCGRDKAEKELAALREKAFGNTKEVAWVVELWVPEQDHWSPQDAWSTRHEAEREANATMELFPRDEYRVRAYVPASHWDGKLDPKRRVTK